MAHLLPRRGLLMAPALLLPPAAQAQSWRPNQPVRVVISAAPGGTLDIHARATQALLSGRMGQPLIVENQGGGAGLVGNQMVGRAAPDGQTMVVASGDGLVLQDILVGARQGRTRSRLRPVTMTITAAP